MTDSEALKIAMRALAWYADEAHWNRDDWGVMGVVASPDYADAGGKARRALKRIRSAGDGMSPTPDLPTGIHVANGERVEILPREEVKRIAYIVGCASAARQALDCIDSGQHGPDAIVVRPVRHRDSLIVTAASNVVPIA